MMTPFFPLTAKYITLQSSTHYSLHLYIFRLLEISQLESDRNTQIHIDIPEQMQTCLHLTEMGLEEIYV